MRLENNYYKIVNQNKWKDRGIFLIELLDGCSVYRGHFPDDPVCPGVFNIQTIKECAEVLTGCNLHISSIRQCRFKAVATPIICPKLHVTVEIAPSDGGYAVKASIADAVRVYMEYQGDMCV